MAIDLVAAKADYKNWKSKMQIPDGGVLIIALVAAGLLYAGWLTFWMEIVLVVCGLTYVYRRAHEEGYMEGYEVGFDEGRDDALGIDREMREFRHELEIERSLGETIKNSKKKK